MPRYGHIADVFLTNIYNRLAETLNRNIANWPSDYPLPSTQVSDLKTVDVDNFPSDYPLPSAQISSLQNVNVQPQGSIQHFSVSSTSDVKTPSSGKALQILAFFYYCDADITTELRFKSSGNVIAGLPFKGAVAMNLIGVKPPQGAANEAVEIYLSGSGNVKGWICYKEV